MVLMFSLGVVFRARKLLPNKPCKKRVDSLVFVPRSAPVQRFSDSKWRIGLKNLKETAAGMNVGTAVPVELTFPAIDCIMFGLQEIQIAGGDPSNVKVALENHAQNTVTLASAVGLQMTTKSLKYKSGHPINSSGLQNQVLGPLNDAQGPSSGKFRIMFVVSTEHYDAAVRQSFTTETTEISMDDLVEQWVMDCLPYADMKKNVCDWPDASGSAADVISQ